MSTRRFASGVRSRHGNLVHESLRLCRSRVGVDRRQGLGTRLLVVASRLRGADAFEVVPLATRSVMPLKSAWQTAELSPRTFCTLPREFSPRRLGDAADRPGRVERGEEAADDRFHTEHGTPATALRPPPPAPRPTHRRHDRRHGPRHPRSTARGWLGAAPTVVGLSECGGLTEPEPPSGHPAAAPTRPEADGVAPARAGPATNLRVSPHGARRILRRAVRTCVRRRRHAASAPAFARRSRPLRSWSGSKTRARAAAANWS